MLVINKGGVNNYHRFRERSTRVSKQWSRRAWWLLGYRRARSLRLVSLRWAESVREGRDNGHRREAGETQSLPADEHDVRRDRGAAAATGASKERQPATTEAWRLEASPTPGQCV